jgi:type I restriction enzyme M protein
MNLQELLTQLESPIVIRPTRRMTQGELESYLDKAADILRGNADHSEFRGYVFALLFYKRISDCFDEEVRTQTDETLKAGVPQDQALLLAETRRTTTSSCPKAAWATVARTAKAQLGQALNDAMLPSSGPTPTARTTSTASSPARSTSTSRTSCPATSWST